ncbi:MarR family winged helix-turn-helix transcriptional regulator [Actinomycetospora sp. CA-084318]|uniref:MarR family winged helix-turn-helix transcriptional regulator n=1 Tax=Actinomycetospora sp. CA-084318 TaxID=3239892 RepID=UPI003D9999F5
MADEVRHAAIRGLPGLADLDDATLAVNDVIGASRELTVRAARAMGMNTTDMAAVHLLAEFGPMGTTGLAARLGITQASTTVLVDRLERAGHVERVRDTADRRRVVLTETPAAREANRAAWYPTIREIDDICAALSDAERAFALDLLNRLRQAMERGARSGEAPSA